MAKRLFDLIAAGLGLALLALPGLLVALAIKLDSPGPVFFRQERVGRAAGRFASTSSAPCGWTPSARAS
jgi:lipopolysaccharide/colanic/teichoic acid biosynthesis glycosyltransferase